MTSVLIRGMQERQGGVERPGEDQGSDGVSLPEEAKPWGGHQKLGERSLPTASGRGWVGVGSVALPAIWFPAGQARVKYIMKAIH